jgi:glutamyl-tRNA synthetase
MSWCQRFDPENLSKAGAIFDIQKLDWLNGRWLREKLSEEEFLTRVLTWACRTTGCFAKA